MLLSVRCSLGVVRTVRRPLATVKLSRAAGGTISSTAAAGASCRLHPCFPTRAARPSLPWLLPGASAPFNSQWRTYAASQLEEQAPAAPVAAAALAEAQLVTSAEGDDAEPVVLDVRGMKCGGCSAAVKRILLQQPGVRGAAVNLLTETAVIQVAAPPGEEARQLAEAAAAAVSSKGFPTSLRGGEDEGLAGDAAALAERKQEELRKSTRNLAFAWGLALVCCTHHLGHFLHFLGLHQFAHTEFMHALGNPWVSGVLGAAALLGPGRPLLVDGALSLLNGAPNMNSLIALGASTSFAAGAASALLPGFSLDPSFLEEPVMLLAFVLLGRSLEARARAAASADLTALARLIPDSARLVLDPGAAPRPKASADGSSGGAAAAPPTAEEVMVRTATVRAGDVVRVLPGERVPVDGVVIGGTASVDESMLTGESRLVPVSEGSSVTGGTLAYEAPITLRATSTGSASTLAGIGRLVADAQAREAPVQRLADVVAGRFCYGVMAASAATFGFWSLAGANWFPQALDVVEAAGAQAPLLLSLRLAIDVLVVACPCALGLATPTAVLVASSAGAKRGLLLRGGDVIEGLAEVDTVVLDKTGTLTEGRLRLASVRAQPGCSADEVLALAAAAERNTRHPLADALVVEAESRGLSIPLASSSQTHPGEGVWAVVGDRHVAVGRREWVEQRCAAKGSAEGSWDAPHSSSTSSTSSSTSPSSDTEVWVGWSGQGLAGQLLLSDALRPDAHAVVSSLRSRGLQVLLLSGDRHEAVAAMAAAAGIDPANAYAEVRPEGKAALVQQLRGEGRKVAMVGDGVNDAPALASAHVGVAMGGGTAVAGDAAGVVLLGDRLGQVDEALALGRATLAKIRQNLAWAVAYNFVGVPIAAGALLPAYGVALSPSLAGGMMALSSIAVVTNSLSLRWMIDAAAGSSAGSGGHTSGSMIASTVSVQEQRQPVGSSSSN
ncbi:hypothetical protein ABPG77_011223 [Micractinium sp. CCAP 211/92]